MRGWRANLIGSGAILALITAISTGLPMIAEQLPDHHAVTPGQRLEVTDGVTVLPPPGAAQDADSSPQLGKLFLEVRGVRYAIRASAYEQDLRHAEARLRRWIARLRGHHLSGRTHRVATRQGVEGRAGRFTSPEQEGYFAVFVHEGKVVEVVAQGVGLHLGGRLKLVRDTVLTIRFEDHP